MSLCPRSRSFADRMPFSSIVLDVDSTLCGVEGIDWLASRRGAEVGAEIARVTQRAMDGELPLEAVYGERLALIRPTRDEIRALADIYSSTFAPGAREAIVRLRASNVRLVLVSGGIRQAIEPAARELGFENGALHAVALRFDDTGAYVGYDDRSPLTTQDGKGRIVASLALPAPVLAVGDGSTDVSMRASADALAAFTGFVRREQVVRAADHVVSSFDEIVFLALGR